MSRDTAHGQLIHYNDIVTESLVDMPGDVKLTEDRQHRCPNTSLFTLTKEDHTLGYLLQRKLHENPLVQLAGYRVPHPTQHNIQVRVQTGSDGSGREIPTPAQALAWATESCLTDLADLRAQFVSEAARQKIPIEEKLQA